MGRGVGECQRPGGGRDHDGGFKHCRNQDRPRITGSPGCDWLPWTRVYQRDLDADHAGRRADGQRRGDFGRGLEAEHALRYDRISTMGVRSNAAIAELFPSFGAIGGNPGA
jgi:hypothetical protein